MANSHCRVAMTGAGEKKKANTTSRRSLKMILFLACVTHIRVRYVQQQASTTKNYVTRASYRAAYFFLTKVKGLHKLFFIRITLEGKQKKKVHTRSKRKLHFSFPGKKLKPRAVHLVTIRRHVSRYASCLYYCFRCTAQHSRPCERRNQNGLSGISVIFERRHAARSGLACFEGFVLKPEPTDTWLDAADDYIVDSVDSCKIRNFESFPFHKSTCIYRTVWYTFDSRSTQEHVNELTSARPLRERRASRRDDDGVHHYTAASRCPFLSFSRQTDEFSVNAKYLCVDKKDKQQLVHHKHENFLGEIQSRGFVNSHTDDDVGFPRELGSPRRGTPFEKKEKKHCTHVATRKILCQRVFAAEWSECEQERETRDSAPTDSCRRGADRRRPNKTNGHAPRLYEAQVCGYSHGAMIRSVDADTRTDFFHYNDYHYYINANATTKVYYHARQRRVGSRATIVNQISSRYSPYPKNKHREPRSQLKPLKISKKSDDERREESSFFFPFSPSLVLARATETAGESTGLLFIGAAAGALTGSSRDPHAREHKQRSRRPSHLRVMDLDQTFCGDSGQLENMPCYVGLYGSDWKMSQDTATVLGVERPPSRPPPTYSSRVLCPILRLHRCTHSTRIQRICNKLVPFVSPRTKSCIAHLHIQELQRQHMAQRQNQHQQQLPSQHQLDLLQLGRFTPNDKQIELKKIEQTQLQVQNLQRQHMTQRQNQNQQHLQTSRTSGDFPVRRVCVSKRMKFSGSLACVDFRCAAAEATSTAAVNLESEREREKCSLRVVYGGIVSERIALSRESSRSLVHTWAKFHTDVEQRNKRDTVYRYKRVYVVPTERRKKISGTGSCKKGSAPQLEVPHIVYVLYTRPRASRAFQNKARALKKRLVRRRLFFASTPRATKTTTTTMTRERKFSGCRSLPRTQRRFIRIIFSAPSRAAIKRERERERERDDFHCRVYNVSFRQILMLARLAVKRVRGQESGSQDIIIGRFLGCSHLPIYIQYTHALARDYEDIYESRMRSCSCGPRPSLLRNIIIEACTARRKARNIYRRTHSQSCISSLFSRGAPAQTRNPSTASSDESPREASEEETCANECDTLAALLATYNMCIVRGTYRREPCSVDASRIKLSLPRYIPLSRFCKSGSSSSSSSNSSFKTQIRTKNGGFLLHSVCNTAIDQYNRDQCMRIAVRMCCSACTSANRIIRARTHRLTIARLTFFFIGARSWRTLFFYESFKRLTLKIAISAFCCRGRLLVTRTPSFRSRNYGVARSAPRLSVLCVYRAAAR
ncbi:unnamed protein product, partial [Trichogramma brassicae]